MVLRMLCQIDTDTSETQRAQAEASYLIKTCFAGAACTVIFAVLVHQSSHREDGQ